MIKKYSSIEKSNDPLWVFHPDENYHIKMNDFFILIEKLSGFKVKSGIQKIKNPFTNDKRKK